jgi:hypothetical protein
MPILFSSSFFLVFSSVSGTVGSEIEYQEEQRKEQVVSKAQVLFEPREESANCMTIHCRCSSRQPLLSLGLCLSEKAKKMNSYQTFSDAITVRNE